MTESKQLEEPSVSVKSPDSPDSLRTNDEVKHLADMDNTTSSHIHAAVKNPWSKIKSHPAQGNKHLHDILRF